MIDEKSKIMTIFNKYKDIFDNLIYNSNRNLPNWSDQLISGYVIYLGLKVIQ